MTTLPVTIPPSRISQIDSTIRNFITSFENPITSLKAFTSILHPSIDWHDHAFLNHRHGHDAIVGLQKAFTHCNQPFRVDIKAIIPTSTGAILEQVWLGRQANDIIRPDGVVAVKASGKEFQCHVCMIIAVDEDGRIRRIDEYYNKDWDLGVREEEYVVIKGGSLKANA